MTNQASIQQFAERGYVVARQLFSPSEVQILIQHFMDLRAQGGFPGDFAGVDANSSDPLKRFPRMIHMHRWDQLSLEWMIDTRLNAWMTALLGREPYAVQTMLYFKPAGARGQALHQDQFYLQVQPGTCMAAWLALDDCDEENGCLQVVPGTHNIPVLCTTEADTNQSFTDVTVPIPEGYQRSQHYERGRRTLFQRPTGPRQLSQHQHRSLPSCAASSATILWAKPRKWPSTITQCCAWTAAVLSWASVSVGAVACGRNQAGEPAVEMMEPA
ncbi:MAG: phytanoyl-CoA dioxygenase family protein [Caldilineaceae bacterium]